MSTIFSDEMLAISDCGELSSKVLEEAHTKIRSTIVPSNVNFQLEGKLSLMRWYLPTYTRSCRDTPYVARGTWPLPTRVTRRRLISRYRQVWSRQTESIPGIPVSTWLDVGHNQPRHITTLWWNRSRHLPGSSGPAPIAGPEQPRWSAPWVTVRKTYVPEFNTHIQGPCLATFSPHG